MYVDDNRDELPLNRTMANPSFSTMGSWVVGSTKTDRANVFIKFGTLYPYVKSLKTFKCPADQIDHNRTYSMNCGFNWFDDVDLRDLLPLNVLAMRFADIARPVDSFVFLEENADSVDDGFFGVAWQNSTAEWMNMPGTAHNKKRTVLSYADGHVSELKWKVDKVFNTYNQLITDTNELNDLILMQNQILPQ